jgi:hypothetical protein
MAVATWWVTTLPASAASPTTASTVLPSTLAGETLAASQAGFPSLGCSVGSFTTSGTASGPYPGTFTETGSLTGVPAAPGGRVLRGVVTAFDSTFTITADDGSTVTGTKTLDLTAAPGVCANVAGPLRAFDDHAPLTYDARIATGGVTYRDIGTASADLIGRVPFFQPAYWSLTETFSASNGLLPTDMSQCKHGGWALFGIFKNQGDCVSYIATGGKNPPAG